MISEFLYGSEKCELVFDVPVESAIERLSANVTKTSASLLTFTSEGMVGHVNKNSVKINRMIPRVRNSFRPVFVGSFATESSQTILKGVFRFDSVVRVFMTFWFGFVALLTLLASAAVLTEPTKSWFIPLAGVLMFCVGIGMVKLGKSFSRDDRTWLEENISHAINQKS